MSDRIVAEESAVLTTDVTGKRWRALLIKRGWGSTGFYTEETLKRDGPNVFKAGTPVFIDHQTPQERELKPFGSVENFAGELATDAYWDAEEGGLVADIEIFEHRQPMVKALASKIGLSIRSRAYSELGEADGKHGKIITGLFGARSVDMVVRAGAGGQMLEALESEIEEMEENMDEKVLEAIKELQSSVDTRFVAVEESLAALATAQVAEVEETIVAEVEETKVDIEAVIASAVAQAIAALPAATVTQESAEEEGSVESAEEVEESATLELPRRWVVKEKN